MKVLYFTTAWKVCKYGVISGTYLDTFHVVYCETDKSDNKSVRLGRYKNKRIHGFHQINMMLKTSYICRTRLIWSCNGDFLYFQVKVFSQCDFPPNLSKTWHLKWVYNFLGCEHKSKVLNLFKAKNKYTRIHQRCI